MGERVLGKITVTPDDYYLHLTFIYFALMKQYISYEKSAIPLRIETPHRKIGALRKLHITNLML